METPREHSEASACVQITRARGPQTGARLTGRQTRHVSYHTARAPAHLRVACLRTAGKIRALWLLISSGLGFASPRWPCLSGVWVRSGRRLARVSISNETSRTAKLTNREILESTSRAVSIDLFDDFKRPKSELCGKKKTNKQQERNHLNWSAV